MKGTSKITAIVYRDKELMRLFSGLIASGIGLLSIAITACLWYL
jgi:hypothetical protein